MSYTPFEREMLKRQDRTNELLELLVMAHQPTKIADRLMPGETVVEALRGIQAAATGTPIESAMAAAGLVPMAGPRSGRPPTDEERAARFAERAKEVGLSDEAAAEVSGRVQLNLDTLAPEPGDVVSDPPAPAGPRKRTPKRAQ